MRWNMRNKSKVETFLKRIVKGKDDESSKPGETRNVGDLDKKPTM